MKSLNSGVNKMFNPVVLEGLRQVQTSFVNNWAGPLFLIIVAGVSITFLIRREFRMLFSFLAIAAVVGVLIFFGGTLFGSGGKLTGVAKQNAEKLNTFLPYLQTLKFW